ncbi:MAG: hypothetical protein ACK4YO_03355, partial [Candidatus Altarchaeaceae archaeon]
MNIVFPYEKIREGQKEFLKDIVDTVNEGKILIAHAPTGIGKTAAVLGGTLKFAIENDKVILFLTPKHTQHLIVIDTLKKIKEKFNIGFYVSEIIGKQYLCMFDEADEIPSSHFYDWCRAKKERDECEYIENINKIKTWNEDIKKILDEKEIIDSGKIKEISRNNKICAYEVAMKMAKISKVIICDYLYIFSKSIMETFLSRIEKNLNDLIIVVDEAHNLSQRIRETHSDSMSEKTIERALKESEKIKNENLQKFLFNLKKLLKEFEGNDGNEWRVEKEKFIERVEDIASVFDENFDYDDLIINLESIGEEILLQSDRHISYIKSISNFLYYWKNTGENFAKILRKEIKKDGEYLVLENKCL